jgi:hypothetical protein
VGAVLPVERNRPGGRAYRHPTLLRRRQRQVAALLSAERDKHGQEIEDRIYNQRDFDRSIVFDQRTELVARKVFGSKKKFLESLQELEAVLYGAAA